MKCPNCKHEIPAAEIAKHLGKRGGRPRDENPSKKALRERERYERLKQEKTIDTPNQELTLKEIANQYGVSESYASDVLEMLKEEMAK